MYKAKQIGKHTKQSAYCMHVFQTELLSVVMYIHVHVQIHIGSKVYTCTCITRFLCETHMCIEQNVYGPKC